MLFNLYKFYCSYNIMLKMYRIYISYYMNTFISYLYVSKPVLHISYKIDDID